MLTQAAFQSIKIVTLQDSKELKCSLFIEIECLTKNYQAKFTFKLKKWRTDPVDQSLKNIVDGC